MKRNSLHDLFDAICQVESGWNPSAVNREEGAVGVAQIRRICLLDVQRMASEKEFTEMDRFSPTKSFEMFKIYIEKYCHPFDFERAARIWNGGPRGYEKKSTEVYWEKVKAVINSQPSSQRFIS